MGEPRSNLYRHMGKAWKSACRIIFGSEVGELHEFEQYLLEYSRPPRKEISSLSGKEVTLAKEDYGKKARFASFGEIDFGRKFEPLSINEVKDIDSIVEAVRERMIYSGNIVLGNSSFVEQSSNIIDSHYIYCSNAISDSKSMAYCRELRFCENCFGFYCGATSNFAIRAAESGTLSRCFECLFCETNSDIYYCMGTDSSRDCMFCFGVLGGAFMIGNHALPKDKYLSIKGKILGEIAQSLSKEKKAVSLLGIIEKAGKEGGTPVKICTPPDPPFSIKPIEDAFSRTASIIFGKPLHNIGDYAKFLQKHVPENIATVSPLTKRRIFSPGNLAHLLQAYQIGARTLDIPEIRQVGRMAIGRENALNISLEGPSLPKTLEKIAYASFDMAFGNIRNVSESASLLNAEDCYKGSNYVHSKKCAYCFWPRNSDHIFGSCAAWESSFCINAYFSKKLLRAFEADNCDSCADICFCHNCENVNDSMFCFNAKNKRHAIGNAPLNPEEYKMAKEALLAQMASELEKGRDLKWDIFNVGE